MACQKCRKIGKEPKVYRYAKDGRWRRVETCQHGTREYWRETKIVRKPTLHIHRCVYTAAMDDFILRNYDPTRRSYGTGANKAFAKRFREKFSVPATLNALGGRYFRMKRKAATASVRQTPSLPVLKFMASEV